MCIRDRYTGAEIVHPQADWLTPMRVETLLNLLPTGLVTVTTYHSSRRQDMLVHDLRGGKSYVPHHMVTIKDLLRLLVEEEWRKHSTKVAATRAFNNISILPRESWLTAAARFVQFYRASTVDSASPYASEETYFWSQLPVDQLDHLQTKLIELCIPQPIDRTAKEAQLNVRKESYEADLEAMPIARHELGLSYMDLRGKKPGPSSTRASRPLSVP